MKKIHCGMLAIATTFGIGWQIADVPIVLAKMTAIQIQQYNETQQAAAALYKSKDLDRARGKYAEALQLAKAGDDYKNQMHILLWIGVIYQDQKDYSQAEKTFKDAIALADKNPEVGDVRLSKCLLELARTYIADNKNSDAKEPFARCIELSHKIYSPNHPTLSTRTIEYAKLLQSLGDNDEAKQLSQDAGLQINAFMADASTKIKKAWQPPPENFSYRLAVLYQILDHGKVGSVEVTQSSGSPTADKAAIAAVKAAQPFTDIESKDEGESVDMIFNFDYNYNASKRSPSETIARHTPPRHQSKEVQAETEARLNDERVKSSALKEQIDNLKDGRLTEKEFVALYDQYAKSLITQGLYTEAAEFLNQALKRPECQDIHSIATLSFNTILGHIYLAAKKLGNSEDTLKNVIDDKNFSSVSNTLRAQALTDYGNAISKSGKFTEAQDYFDRAREIEK